MAKPERVLRVAGIYHRKAGISEKEFHDYLSHRHGVESAKIHEKYGILKYQMVFNNTATRALAGSLGFPFKFNNHDLEIEYYFKDAAALVAISANKDFGDLHQECLPYINIETATVTLAWVEVYLEDGKLVNIDAAGKSLQPSFEELSDIKVAETPIKDFY